GWGRARRHGPPSRSRGGAVRGGEDRRRDRLSARRLGGARTHGGGEAPRGRRGRRGARRGARAGARRGGGAVARGRRAPGSAGDEPSLADDPVGGSREPDIGGSSRGPGR